MKRINITLDDIVVKNADDFCKENNISRSALIGIALTDYIKAQRMLPDVKKEMEKQLNDLMIEISEKFDSMKLTAK